MLKNGFYNTLGSVLRLVVSVLTVPLLIRFIGSEEYGLWTLISATVGLLGLASAGLSTSTTVFVSQDLANEDVNGISKTLTIIFGSMFILATTAACAVWISAAHLMSFFPKLDPEQVVRAVQALKVSGLVVWLQLFESILVGLQQAYQQYGTINVLNTVSLLFRNVGLLVIGWFAGETVALMQWTLVTAAASLIGHGYVSFQLIRHINLRPIFDRHRGWAIVNYSLMTWLTSIGGILFSQVDRFIVGSVLGTKELGIYAAITNITQQINTLSSVPVQPLLPEISSLIAKKDLDILKIKKSIKQAFEINALIALGLGGSLFIFAPIILKAMISDAISSELIFAFRSAIIIYALYSLNAVGFFTLLGVNLVGRCMTIRFGSAALSILLIYWGASQWGLVGACLGNGGYLGIWLFNIYGMKSLSIPIQSWFQWLKFPLLFFSLVILASFVVSDNFPVTITLMLFQLTIWYIWFMKSQSLPWNYLIHKISAVCKV